MSKIVEIKSVFPADKKLIFKNLQKLETLQYIAKPYATFNNINGERNLTWEPGKSFLFQFRLFGFISLGTHRIEVKEFSENGIFTVEGNSFCPIWNHRIILREIDGTHTEYTDEVEIDAGWRTIFVYVWAKAFYKHRQRKWLTLLK